MMDLDVHRVVKIKYKPFFVSEYHTHAFFHYIYILDGIGVIRVGDDSYVSQADDFILVSPGIFHEISTFEKHSFKAIEVKFTVGNDDLVDGLNGLPRRINIRNHKIRHLLDLIMLEADRKEKYYKYIINVKFADVLTSLLRMTNVKDGTEDSYISDREMPAMGDRYLQAVLEYIENNINEDLQVRQLARIASLSESYFCAMFREQLGVSPIKYINNVKLAKAKELMRYSDMNISQIAECLGFASLHYFSKFFKLREGVPPTKFLFDVKDNISVNIDEAAIGPSAQINRTASS